MRLLFITQKIDAADDLLGVYHEWLKSLARRVEKINAVCLFQGRVDLPPNIAVYSLGKEGGRSRLKYLFRFFKYLWSLRRDYDVVFVHMNPEYVILGGIVWKLFNKRIVFWYAHYLATFRLRIAEFFADRIVTSVRLAYPRVSRKVVAVGQGIAVERFNLPPRQYSAPLRILFLGRLSPVKDLETLIRAAGILAARGLAFHLNLVGAPTDRDVRYAESMRGLVAELGLTARVSFLGRVPNAQTPAVYADHDIFVNLTRTGSFDKSTLEAMAAGLPVVVSNLAYREILPENLRTDLIFKEGNAADLADKISALASRFAAGELSIGGSLKKIITDHHSLGKLSEKLIAVLSDESPLR